MMFSLRFSLPSRCSFRLTVRYLSQPPMYSGKVSTDQIEYIKSLEGNTQDWLTVKNEVLSKRGLVNQKNFDSVLLKTLTSLKKFDVALSYASYLKTLSNDLSLGSIIGLLGLYSKVVTVKELSEIEKKFILDSYKNLYEKYKVLDSITCERLIHALCAINEFEKAFKVLDNLKLSGVPSHSAYSTIIAALFNRNKKAKAFELITKSLNDKRPLLHEAYEAWINYLIRKYSDKKTIAKYLDEICLHIAKNCTVVTNDTANTFVGVYKKLGWNVNFTKIKKINGECVCCKGKLECLRLTPDEFKHLQQNVKEKIIVGSNLFLNSSPEELNEFLQFVERTAPYDIVLDSLNIAHSVGKSSFSNKASFLNHIVDYFRQDNKKVLLLGRKHMLKWPKPIMQSLMSKADCFFTENISEDDPYLIAAAILSGSHTDLMSKDLLRGHRFMLGDEYLMGLFRRWQWQHQWMVFLNARKGFIIQEPLKFTPCAQKQNGGWHLPYKKPDSDTNAPQVNDGTPDLCSWICIKPANR